jgi:Recombination endonuclease VII
MTSPAQCSSEECENPTRGKLGLCKTCYNRALRSGELPNSKPCSREDCEGWAMSKGLCQKHYGALVRARGCKVEGCTNNLYGSGFCIPHWEEAKGPRPECQEDGCNVAARWRGHCQKHYRQLVNAGQIEPLPCKVPGCDAPMRGDGTRCDSHANRKWKYKLTDEEMAALDRGVTCKLCPELATVVDHCHATGVVRGFLCHGCNVGLGSFRDNPEALSKAAQYVQRGDTARVRDIQTQLGLAA